MLNIDDWRVMYEGQGQDLLKLRASLAKANALSIRADVDRYDYLMEIDRLRDALEVARRELGEARAWKVEYCRQVAEKDEQVAEVHLLLFKAEADRDAALAQAAGLRDALTQVSKLAGNWQTQDQIYDIMREALATPGPTIGEIKAEALESLAEHNDKAISRMTSPRAALQAHRAKAARLWGGGE